MTAPPPACRNCGAPLTGAFCARCGQRNRSDVRLRFEELARDAFAAITDLDRPFPRTLRRLTVDPAGLCADYLAGRRKPYTSPVAYAMLVGAALTFTQWVLGASFFDLGTRAFGTTPDPATSPERERAMFEFQRAWMEMVQDWQHLWKVLTYPVIGVLLALLFRREPRRTVAEWTVVAFYTRAHMDLLGAVLAPLGLYDSLTSSAILVIPTVFYTAWTLRGLTGCGWLEGVGKSLVTIVGYLVAVLLTMLAVTLAVLVGAALLGRI